MQRGQRGKFVWIGAALCASIALAVFAAWQFVDWGTGTVPHNAFDDVFVEDDFVDDDRGGGDYGVLPEADDATQADDNVATGQSSGSSSQGASASQSTSATPTSSADTGSATGDGVNDFGACNDDARAYCSGFYSGDWASWAEEHGYVNASWKLGLVDCLDANRAYTTQACDDSLDRRAGLNTDMVEACTTDRIAYCHDTVPQPGAEPLVDCLKEHYSELTAECTEALDAHEAAKPVD